MNLNYRYLWLELAAWHRFWTAPVSYEEITPDADRIAPMVVAILFLEFAVMALISGALRPI